MAQPESGDERWERLVEVAADFALKHPDAVLVGWTVAALYAGHRVSLDADFVLTDLRERFDELVGALEADPDWVTARLRAPVLVLGRFKGVETGLRQIRRSANGARSIALRPSTICSAIASPSAAECLKPWPEHALASSTRGRPGWRSTTKPRSGVVVYRHARARTMRPATPCSRPATCRANISRASSSPTERSTASG